MKTETVLYTQEYPAPQPVTGRVAVAEAKKRLSITVEFKDAAILEHIKKQAEKDDRSPANWLRKKIVDLHAENKL